MKEFDKYRKKGAYHWDVSYEQNKSYRDRVDLIVNLFSKISDKDQGKLIDVGCGDGLISYKLSKAGFSVVGIDYDSTAINLAIDRCADAETIEFVNADAFSLDGKYEYLLASDIIEHIENPEVLTSLIKRFDPKFFVITTPINKDSGLWDPDYHCFEWSRDEFQKFIKAQFSDTDYKHEFLDVDYSCQCVCVTKRCSFWLRTLVKRMLHFIKVT
ncbi:MAG: class I SAM-dependent methyltransferase [Candidatus Theseobacter exili]|nr:class I SAM-dependent methyltransferase [Candidatus Theseobacter exili]